MRETLAVILPAWVGDAVMATPALRALANQLGGNCRMLGVMQAPVAEVLRGTNWFDGQILYNKRRIADRMAMCLRLRAAKPDAVVLFTNSLWTAVAARLSGARQRLGYARDGRRWLLSEAVPTLEKDGRRAAVPAIDYYLQLVARLGCSIQDRRMELAIEDADRRAGDQLFDRIGFDRQRPTVVINSSGLWGVAKIWPADHVEQLARRIADHHPWQVLLHCGPAERAAADAVAARLAHPAVQSMGRANELPLGLTKAVMERAAVVVSTDSGPRHIAVALNKPVVSLFGPTDPAWTRTYNHPEIELGLEMDCRGCWQKSCPLVHNRCMRDLGVETVYGAVVSAVMHHQRRVA